MTTSRSEDVLYSSLTDVDALETLYRVGLEERCIPTQAMRPVVAWALGYFEQTGMKQAPSRQALLESWGQVIEDAEVEIAEENVEIDDILWAIKSLKAHYILWRYQQFQKESAETIHASVPEDRMEALEKVTHELVAMTMSLRDRTQEVEGIDGFRASVADYRRRAEESLTHRGMSFGIKAIDDHTYGLHEGELCVLAAGPKTGKSVAAAYIALEEWKKQRITTMYTLENSVQMTYDRLVCMHLGIDHDAYRRGLCLPEQVDMVETWIHERGEEMKEHLRVIQPQKGQRNVQWITRHARSVGTQSLMIDQLTFLEASHRSLRGPDKITDIMHDLKGEVSTGHKKMATLLVHQIHREGMREAAKKGFLEMWMLAEGSEVERTADLVIGLYASPDERKAQMMKWITMAFRRQMPKHYRMAWRPWVGQVEALGEIEPAS
jgi:replicative DNA helicase